MLWLIAVAVWSTQSEQQPYCRSRTYCSCCHISAVLHSEQVAEEPIWYTFMVIYLWAMVHIWFMV